MSEFFPVAASETLGKGLWMNLVNHRGRRASKPFFLVGNLKLTHCEKMFSVFF